MTNTVVKAVIRKGPDQQFLLSRARIVTRNGRPIYTSHRRCISGDVDYRAAYADNDKAERIMRLLWKMGVPASLSEGGVRCDTHLHQNNPDCIERRFGS